MFILYFLLAFFATPVIPAIICNENFSNLNNKILSKAITSFEVEALNEHNRLRALHGVPPLKLNNQLSNYAKEWAENLAKGNAKGHRPNSKYGENLYQASGIQVNGRTPVKNWYDEIQNFDFENGGFALNTGHFTQVVWKNTKEVGIGFAKKGNSIWVVANYSPPGNYAGQFRENVPRPLK